MKHCRNCSVAVSRDALSDAITDLTGLLPDDAACDDLEWASRLSGEVNAVVNDFNQLMDALR